MLYLAYFFEGTGDEVPSPRTYDSRGKMVRDFANWTVETGRAIPYQTSFDDGFGNPISVIIDSAYAVVYGPFDDDDDKVIASMDAAEQDGVGLPRDLGEPSAHIEFGPRGGIHVRTTSNTFGEDL